MSVPARHANRGQGARWVPRHLRNPPQQPRSWIDGAVGRDAHVAMLWTGGNALAMWENEFWNRSVDRVYNLRAPLPGDMPSTHVKVGDRIDPTSCQDAEKDTRLEAG